MPDPKADLKVELEDKRRKFQELVRQRNKASCSSVVSTEIDVRRETEIEELEEQILELERSLAGG